MFFEFKIKKNFKKVSECYWVKSSNPKTGHSDQKVAIYQAPAPKYSKHFAKKSIKSLKNGKPF